MSIYSYPPLIAGISIMLLGFFVFFHNKNSSLNRVFALMCLSIFIWLNSYSIIFSVKSKELGLFWSRFSYIGVIFIPITVHHISVLFLNILNKRNKNLIILSYVLGIGFLILSRTNYFFDDVYSYFWGYYPKANFLYLPFLVFFVFFYGRGLLLLFLYLMKRFPETYYNSRKYIQIKYVFWALFIAVIASVDYVAKFGVQLYPFGYIFMTCYVSILAYAIVAHQLMEIEVIIKKTLIYSILISIITILYFIVVYILERMFSIMIGYQSITLAIIIIAFFSIIFIPLKNKIQRTIDRYFFKGTIDQIVQEKKLLEGELQRSERLKTVSTLAAGMAHEIKNPLTSIKTFAEYLEKKYNDPAFRNKFKNIVPKEIDKISKIINQLLDYSKVDKVSLKACNINSILDYVLDLYNNEFLKKHIKIQKSFNSQSLNITCDENQMKQAFINIVLNSIEAMPNGGELTIRTNDIDNILEVSIKDTGTGIPSDKLKCLFDPFYTTKQKGTGLGLFIVHQIIENNKGKIVIDTEIGKGTTIKVMFVR